MRRCLAIGIICMTAIAFASSEDESFKRDSVLTRDSRMAWWRDARFGMFIHWGLYSMPARHEWVMRKENMTREQYQKYFRHFNPRRYDAKQWAKTAKDAGMRYAVFTAKHHEGFCMWDSAFTDFKVTNTPLKRDVLREFVDAFRAEGLRVGIYYSLIDWQHPDFTVDRQSPGFTWKKQDKYQKLDTERIAEANKGRDMERYRVYLKNQIRELLSNYGKIDILWFDFSYPGAFGKTRNDWDSEGIVRLIRELQPQALLDNRLDLKDTDWGWDFLTPEQYAVKSWPTWKGKRVPWENCQTFSGSWGYYRDEETWKNPHQLVSLLVQSVSCGGNLIMNVGPTAMGEFDPRAVDALSVYGRWLRVNADSVYGCTIAPEGFETPDGTVLTYHPKTNRLYLHLLNYPVGSLPFGFADKIDYAQFLHDGSEVKITRGDASAISIRSPEDRIELPIRKPDVVIPVIEFFLKPSEK